MARVTYQSTDNKLPAAQLERTRHLGPLVGPRGVERDPWRAATQAK
jgi:hypothetical protein